VRLSRAGMKARLGQRKSGRTGVSVGLGESRRAVELRTRVILTDVDVGSFSPKHKCGNREYMQGSRSRRSQRVAIDAGPAHRRPSTTTTPGLVRQRGRALARGPLPNRRQQKEALGRVQTSTEEPLRPIPCAPLFLPLRAITLCPRPDHHSSAAEQSPTTHTSQALRHRHHDVAAAQLILEASLPSRTDINKEVRHSRHRSNISGYLPVQRPTAPIQSTGGRVGVGGWGWGTVVSGQRGKDVVSDAAPRSKPHPVPKIVFSRRIGRPPPPPTS